MQATGRDNREVRLKMVDLPPFPAVALRALQLVSKSDTRLTDLHNLICSDPAFSIEILRLANSPLYGIRVEVKSTLQATMLLGFERVRALAFTIGMRAFLGEAMQFPALQTCWRHSLACALIAEELAAAGPIEKSVAYTAGLIHDIGRLALAAIQPHEYEALVRAEGEPLSLEQRELQVFAIDHCQAGKFLVEAWRLPEQFADIASRHHEPRRSSDFDLLNIIILSCRLADVLGFGFAAPAHASDYQSLTAELPESVREILPADADTLADRIDEKMASFESIDGTGFYHAGSSRVQNVVTARSSPGSASRGMGA